MLKIFTIFSYFPQNEGALSPKTTHTCKYERSKGATEDPQRNC